MENFDNVKIRPAEVFTIWVDWINMKVYMTNVKTGERVEPEGVDIS